MTPELLTPSSWHDYELIDCGGTEKLERFGDKILRRPEPQALWEKSMTENEWTDMATAYFKKHKAESEKGEWLIKPDMPEQWYVKYDYNNMHFTMRLGLTAFKHVGIFPEQGANWNYIYDTVQSLKAQDNEVKVLNLFAYTGGASLAARSAGANVTHVDSIKQVVTWASSNMTQSSLSDIRWIIEDARKFVKREVKRGNKYNGIILDPPAYGHGAEGEKWVLDRDIYPFLTDCAQLLADDGFVVFNLYSMGLSALLAKGLLEQVFGVENVSFGELYVEDRFKKRLPLGVYCRFCR